MYWKIKDRKNDSIRWKALLWSEYNELKEISELSSTQEEADIKIFLHANHYLESSSSNLTVYSPSGYTDIIVLAVTLLNNFKERLSLIDGHGKDRKYIESSKI